MQSLPSQGKTMTHDCDLCASKERSEIEPGIFVCMGCGFVYVPERRSPQEIAADWSTVYNGGHYDPDWPGVKARLWYVAEWLDQNISLSGKRVLDIGAGNGNFLAFVKERGAIPLALEPDEGNSQKIMSRGIQSIHGCVEDIEHWPQKHDLVTILWTLENCGDCLGMLKWARERLAPGGKVVVATGSRILVPFKKPYGSYFGKLSPDLHCFRWSWHSLANAFSKAGLTPFQANDWMERDELIMMAEINPDAMPSGRDSPLEVVDFFREWKRQWP